MPLSPGDPFNAVISWIDDPGEAKPGPLSGKTLLVKDLIDTAGGTLTPLGRFGGMSWHHLMLRRGTGCPT